MTVLVTGAGGQVGGALVRRAERLGIDVAGLARDALDITDGAVIDAVLDRVRPNVVINPAAFTQVDAAESTPEAAFAVNATAVETLGRACATRGVPLLHLSTDYVFPGGAGRLYMEDDAVAPINAYGRGKAAGEALLREAHAGHVIVRTSWVFDARGSNFVHTMLRLAREHDEVRVVADEVGCPTAADALADALLTLARRMTRPGFGDWGTYHCCGTPAVSRADFARALFGAAERIGGLPTARVRDIPATAFASAARRPADTAMNCDRIRGVFGIECEDWHAGLERMLRELARGERT